MAYNSLIRYETGTLASAQNTGSIVAGISNLAAKGSTGACGVCVDFSGNVFISDSIAHIILKCDRAGNVRVYAGLAGTPGNNGENTVTAANARFNAPEGICCDKSGNVYVADTGNNQIRVISLSQNVSIVAGDPATKAGYVDGPCLDARFSEPHDVAVDNSGRVYVADGNNHAIRVVNGSQVFTVAGNGTAGDAPADYTTRAQGTNARFNTPLGVTVNRSGQVFVSDSANHKIKLIQPDGWVYNFSGSGVSGTTIGTATTSQYQTPRLLDVDRSGYLYLIDFSVGGATSRLVRINLNGLPGVVIDFDSTTGNYVTGVAVDQSGAMYVTASVADLLMSSSSSASSSTFLQVSSSSSKSVSSSSTIRRSSSSTFLKSSSSSQSSASS